MTNRVSLRGFAHILLPSSVPSSIKLTTSESIQANVIDDLVVPRRRTSNAFLSGRGSFGITESSATRRVHVGHSGLAWFSCAGIRIDVRMSPSRRLSSLLLRYSAHGLAIPASILAPKSGDVAIVFNAPHVSHHGAPPMELSAASLPGIS
ncbi:hypothetical protein FZEAL_9162 [Fusarium zealandicum]|uniref:Uncharacterized protein n=1 Tax=Fusarium zealandicum TaxID=1053134 RepID=A0A8H4UCZ2_9HYPO|nr:hypothetical protein FZEAL_9162 [Fusarium zealandicum]